MKTLCAYSGLTKGKKIFFSSLSYVDKWTPAEREGEGEKRRGKGEERGGREGERREGEREEKGEEKGVPVLHENK